MNFQVYNKLEDRPATCQEINELLKHEEEQIFFSWHNLPEDNQKGLVQINIDSGAEDKFELRKL